MIGKWKQEKDEKKNRIYKLYLENGKVKTFKTLYSLLKYINKNDIKYFYKGKLI